MNRWLSITVVAVANLVLVGGCSHGDTAAAPPVTLVAGRSCEQQARAIAEEFQRLVKDSPSIRLDSTVAAGIDRMVAGHPEISACPTLSTDAAVDVPASVAKRFFRSTTDDRDFQRAIEADPVFTDGTALAAVLSQIVRDAT